MKVIINKPFAFELFDILVELYQKKAHPYDNTSRSLPQFLVPDYIRTNPLTHALFLFYSCHYMRGAINSDYAINQLVKLHADIPDLFVPKMAAQTSAIELGRILDERIKYHGNQIASFWIENSRRLYMCWDEDPRLIFVNADANAVRKSIVNNGKTDGFLGFREKMASMVAYFFLDAELIEPLIISPAVDFHILRVMIAQGILIIEGTGKPIRYQTKIVMPVIELLEEYCEISGVDPVEIGDALWLLSKVLCSRAPGNSCVGSKRKKGAGVKPLELDWRKPNLVERYKRSCGSCPAGSTCKLHIFSRKYYDTGLFENREHDRPPLLFPYLPQQKRKEKQTKD